MVEPLKVLDREARIASFLAVAPADFVLPPSFVRVLYAAELPEIYPWWWLIEIEGKVKAWFDIIRDQFPDRTVLVPFAKHDWTDDVFCFDGANSTGDSPVYIVHTFTTPGWEDRGNWETFDVFMEEALETHEDWLREQEDWRRKQDGQE